MVEITFKIYQQVNLTKFNCSIINLIKVKYMHIKNVFSQHFNFWLDFHFLAIFIVR